MVRDIRKAMFKQATDPNFDVKEFDRINEKWTKLLELQEKSMPLTKAAMHNGTFIFSINPINIHSYSNFS